ncbi:KCNU1 isoform 3, partial [Pan troglodytes]|uniref:Potassium calcium-activated channel subfamily U member 1 n=2 Tax=Pan troglodytes TaxID=9598 RepID=A0A2I3RPY5_PANTR
TIKKTEFSNVCSIFYLILQTMLKGLLQLSCPGIASDAGDRRSKFSAGTTFR